MSTGQYTWIYYKYGGKIERYPGIYKHTDEQEQYIRDGMSGWKDTRRVEVLDEQGGIVFFVDRDSPNW